nr:MAG TPA: Helix-turn-helix of insertion element transposase [Caudoviricetes sp.]
MTPNKEKLLAALLTSRTKKEAAAAAGISDRTMRSYFEDKEFCQRYREAFAGVVQDATRRAQQLLEPALSTLQTVMEDEEIPAQARITAARSIIDYSMRLTEQNDIMRQLDELEAWRREQEQR